MSYNFPNFFIIGAPKCGTTSLAQWLGSHDGVYLSPVKEPHYYSTDLANQSIKSSKQYRRLFRNVTASHNAVGESSTWYLYSNVAVQNIEREVCDARYIVMTRDPVSMLHSLYHHNCRVLHEDQPTIEDAWRLQGRRARGECIPKSCVEPAFLQYYSACCVGSHLKRLYDTVAQDRVLHLSLEDVKENPRKAYLQALKFLGLPDDGKRLFPVANEARGYQSQLIQRGLKLGRKIRMGLGFQRGTGLGKLNERPSKKSPLSADFRKELEEAFFVDRQLLNELSTKFSGNGSV